MAIHRCLVAEGIEIARRLSVGNIPFTLKFEGGQTAFLETANQSTLDMVVGHIRRDGLLDGLTPTGRIGDKWDPQTVQGSARDLPNDGWK